LPIAGILDTATISPQTQTIRALASDTICPCPRTGRNLVQSAQMAVSMIWQRQWAQTVHRQSAITLKSCA
jgi:hypothetical protein